MTVKVSYKNHFYNGDENLTGVMAKFEVTQDEFSTLKGAVKDNILGNYIDSDFVFHVPTSQVFLKKIGKQNKQDCKLFCKDFQVELNKALEGL